MRSIDRLVFSLIVPIFFATTGASNAGDSEKPRLRVLYNSDAGELFADFWTHAVHEGGTKPEGMAAIIEQSVDEIARVGVDTLSTVIWDRFFSMVPTSAVPEPNFRYAPLLDAGHDPLAIMLKRCRARRIEFLGCLRMNDRHSGGSMANKGQFIKDHPEWRLQGAPGGMNYAEKGGRSQLLKYLDEILGRYNLDGIEFDFMRHCHVFEHGTGEKNAHLLTDFVRKTRRLLNAAAETRKRGRLVLSVRVPQTLEECRALGFDMATWIREELVDYVVPSDFFYTDFNAKTEDFAELAQSTRVKIYPALHPVVCHGNRPGLNTLANYHAAVRNFAARGASGFQTYNYQYHWAGNHSANYPGPAYMWPGALGYLRELGDLQKLAQYNRHYRFYPLWVRQSPTGFVNDDRIRLDRADSARREGSRRFRMAEDLNDRTIRATMQFKAVGIAEHEVLEVRINDRVVPNKHIIRQEDADGQNKFQGRELDPFANYTIFLSWEGDPPTVPGDNRLTVRLTDVGDSGEGEVTIEELDVYVSVGRKSR